MNNTHISLGAGAHLCFFLACSIIAPILLFGCSHLYEGSRAGSTFKEANDLFGRGSFDAALSKYEGIIEGNPAAADRALYEMGIIYAYPRNEHLDYGKSLECFQKILRDYPASRYRQDSAEMISHIDNAIIKDKRLIAQQTLIAALEREVRSRESENIALQRTIEALEKENSNKESENIAQREKIEALVGELKSRISALQMGPISKVLIEKGERRMILISQDKALKTYKIALGGNPNGPKERQGDNKTPEGTYVIDYKNIDSAYHLSLHISYPNEKDLKRAKELGVSPGGDIMIHGLKNGYSWIGDSHTAIDWTKGCIAVTDAEIEEIAGLVPIGTIVEIKP
jgi:tetratricopeptide (TPR) repeat protein